LQPLQISSFTFESKTTKNRPEKVKEIPVAMVATSKYRRSKDIVPKTKCTPSARSDPPETTADFWKNLELGTKNGGKMYGVGVPWVFFMFGGFCWKALVGISNSY